MIPNNVLILGAPHSGKIRVAQHISKDLNTDEISHISHSGLVYNTSLETKYYSLKLNLLVEEYPENRSLAEEKANKLEFLNAWLHEFLLDEFRELRDVLDGLVFTLDVTDPIAQIERYIEVVVSIKEKLDEEQGSWHGFVAIVGVNEGDTEAVEDAVISAGLEFVHFDEHGMNEFKEAVGKDRLKEIFETHEWSDMDLKSTADYEANKTGKLGEMTRRLLADDDGAEDGNSAENGNGRLVADFDTLLSKLHIAKESVKDMEQGQKEAYVNSVIDDIINYL